MTVNNIVPVDYKERIIVALDVKNEKEALELIKRFEQKVNFVKIGMELFYGAGYSLIEKIKNLNLKIFLDLKLHDIPTTVGKASVQLTRLEVDMFNLHVAGGLKMMEEAKNNTEKALSIGQKKPIILGVTQLTSTDERVLQEEIGIMTTIKEAVINYALLAKKAGLDGVVSSPLEVKSIKDTCGKAFLTVTPGIRLNEGDYHDQKRVTTPVDAFNLGSDYIVIGRAITEAKQPTAVIESIFESLKSGGKNVN